MTRYKIVNQRKLRWVRAADGLLDRLPRRKTRQEVPENPRRILAVRLAYLGDVILTLPALKALKECYPAARLDLLTGTVGADLLAGQPGLDRVLGWDAPWFYPTGPAGALGWLGLIRRLRRDRYDWAVDFRGDIRNAALVLRASGAPLRLGYDSGGGGRFLTHPVAWQETRHKSEFHLDLLRGIGISAPEGETPVIRLPEEEILTMEEELQGRDLPPGEFAAVHPGSRLSSKRWSEMGFQEVIRRLMERGLPVVLLGTAGEAPLTGRLAEATGAVDLAGRLEIRRLAALLSRAAITVANDSAPMHLAAAVGSPVVGIFGPSKPEETAPLGPRSRAVAGPVDCRPECDENGCSRVDGPICLDAVRPEMVWEAVEEILS